MSRLVNRIAKIAALNERVYQPLTDKSAVRLLSIHSGSAPETLRCDLYPILLADQPPYRHLSYCWGDCEDTCASLCDGQDFAVARSLHEVLIKLRAERA